MLLIDCIFRKVSFGAKRGNGMLQGKRGKACEIDAHVGGWKGFVEVND